MYFIVTGVIQNLTIHLYEKKKNRKKKSNVRVYVQCKNYLFKIGNQIDTRKKKPKLYPYRNDIWSKDKNDFHWIYF